MKEKHPLDEFFRDGVGEHETKPSSTVWEKIEGEIGESKKSSGGWYLMRAAAVTVFVALSSYMYYQNQSLTLGSGEPVEAKNNEGDTEQVTPATEKKESENSSSEKQETVPVKEEKSQKVVPIMKTGHKMLVAKEPAQKAMRVPETVDEEQLMAEEEPAELLTASLDEGRVEEASQPKLRVKVRLSPVTGSAFYAANDSSATKEKPDYRERIYAYASDQLGNLANGKLPELPKTKRKPQLEINLGEIFN